MLWRRDDEAMDEHASITIGARSASRLVRYPAAKDTDATVNMIPLNMSRRRDSIQEPYRTGDQFCLKK